MDLRYLLNPDLGYPSHQLQGPSTKVQNSPNLDNPHSPGSLPPSPVFSNPPSPALSVISNSSQHAAPQRSPHNNLRYNQEELDYIRYLHEELGLSWIEVQIAYNGYFPPRRHRSVMGLHSRYYREQVVHVPLSQLESLESLMISIGSSSFAPGPNALNNMQAQFFDDEMVIRQENGDIVLRHRIRDRDTDEGREIRERFGVCYLLRDVAPERLLAYDWPIIRECDRETARMRLGIEEEDEYMGTGIGLASL